MKKKNIKVLIAAIIFITSTATFFILLSSPDNDWVGFWPMIFFTSLAVISAASFMYLLVRSQLVRNLLKGYFGIY